MTPRSGSGGAGTQTELNFQWLDCGGFGLEVERPDAESGGCESQGGTIPKRKSGDYGLLLEVNHS